MSERVKFRQKRLLDGAYHYWGFDIDGQWFVGPLPPTQGGDSHQYIGIDDKNGVEIYHNDWVRKKINYMDYMAQIQWGPRRCCFYADDNTLPPRPENIDSLFGHGVEAIEVIPHDKEVE